MAEIELRDLHVLVVDDDETFLQIIDGVLRSLPVGKITTAKNGADALSKLIAASRPVDVVLCDYRMPSGNGLQLLKAIRIGQVKYTRADACFIMMTGAGDVETIKAAGRLDINGYMVKPLTAEKVRTAISKGRQRVFQLRPAAYAAVEVPESQL